MKKLKFYYRCIRWLYRHREEPDCMRKIRRMAYDIDWDVDRRKK